MYLRELYKDDVELILQKWEWENREAAQMISTAEELEPIEKTPSWIPYAKLVVTGTLGLVSSIALTIISYTARFTNKSNHGFKDWNEQEKVNLLDSYELLGHVTMSLISCEDAMGKLRVWYDRARSSPTQETL
jgi:hypothetical protein